MKNTLKIQRAIHSITQEELANSIGVSRQSINAIESGKFVPSTILALKFARYFNISVEALFILEKRD
ncbi:MAG: helix-turn-helix transcriptional regulator [Bacteroidota bacterium]|nr:helix-turn-helix transcriptional regulator [Bacteroidota bacterium]